MYPLYARRFMLNVIGGAQPIDVLRALTHLILTCGFPHDVVLHRMSSRYLLYISFLKTHWYTATTGIRYDAQYQSENSAHCIAILPGYFIKWIYISLCREEIKNWCTNVLFFFVSTDSIIISDLNFNIWHKAYTVWKECSRFT